MNALLLMKSACENTKSELNPQMRCCFRIFIHFFLRLHRVVAGFVGAFLVTTLLIGITCLMNVVPETRCKFMEDNLICVPYSKHPEWFSMHDIPQRAPYDALFVRAILVDNDYLQPLDLHLFEKNVLLHTPSLSHLVIRESKITYIPNMQSNTELVHFNASFNDIERIQAFDFAGTNLYSLDLSHNKIATINENAFNVRQLNVIRGLNLTEINLANNRLTRALPEWFQFLKKLKKIDLRNNLIAAVDNQFLLSLNRWNSLEFDEFIANNSSAITRNYKSKKV